MKNIPVKDLEKYRACSYLENTRKIDARFVGNTFRGRFSIYSSRVTMEKYARASFIILGMIMLTTLPCFAQQVKEIDSRGLQTLLKNKIPIIFTIVFDVFIINPILMLLKLVHDQIVG